MLQLWDGTAYGRHDSETLCRWCEFCYNTNVEDLNAYAEGLSEAALF